MCGVAGYVSRVGGAEESILDAMLDRIPHRGPDDRGTWCDGPVGLGHVRLSVIDLSARGHQPILTPDGRGVLSYNGEVYNFRELRTELEQEGARFRSTTDSEVVLEALHRWGPEAATRRFDGMFAFAYLDRRDGTLWLGRDRLGIKPLYVARSERALVFGSEVKALLAHPDVESRPDVHAVVTQIVLGRLDRSQTPLVGVEPVLPGTLVEVREGVRVRTYYDVLRDVDPERIRAGDADDFAAQERCFEEHLAGSVERHLISDAPVATMCSGGLDSGLVTALATRSHPGLVAYVADIGGMGGVEVERARTVCRRLDVELRTVDVGEDNYYRLWPRAVLASDQPNYFSQSIATMAVSEAMNRDGFKVMLTGDGADELLGGYPWYLRGHRMWRRRRWHSRLVPDHPLTRALGKRVPWLAPLDLDDLAERPFTGLRDSTEGLTGPAVCAVDGARRRLRAAALFRKLAPLPLHEERAFLARSFEDVYVHLGETLRSLDRMAMSFSIEARPPFLGNDLIDFSLHLPCRAKLRRGVQKPLVAALAARLLPAEVLRLPKIGFRVPPSMWMGMEGFLRNGRVADMLRWAAADQDAILRLVRERSFFLFRMLTTEIWIRMLFEGEPPERITEALLSHRRGRDRPPGVSGWTVATGAVPGLPLGESSTTESPS